MSFPSPWHVRRVMCSRRLLLPNALLVPSSRAHMLLRFQDCPQQVTFMSTQHSAIPSLMLTIFSCSDMLRSDQLQTAMTSSMQVRHVRHVRRLKNCICLLNCLPTKDLTESFAERGLGYSRTRSSLGLQSKERHLQA